MLKSELARATAVAQCRRLGIGIELEERKLGTAFGSDGHRDKNVRIALPI